MSRPSHRIVLAMALLCAGGARADDPDAGALMLADQAPEPTQQSGNLRTFIEAAHGGATRRNNGGAQDNQRLSLDIRHDRSFSPGWRAFLADRLDMSWPAPAGAEKHINTLKEAYLSWQARPETLLDAGRVNVRNGVATGYNPTDYFRGGALRSVVSISPASLKENRQGSIMLRGQGLWNSGSLTMLYSPKLSDQAGTGGGLSPDVGATNHRDRWLATVSQKIGAGLTPQFLIYREAARPTQFGLNLTGLINDATVAHLEWSGGRGPSQLTRALGPPAPACPCDSWRNHLATGLTHTTANKLSLTGEYHYNGAGLDKAEWNALGQAAPRIYGQYRGWAQSAQEPPTRRMLFFYGTWQDALINHLDLSAMHHFDLVDSSRRTWLEARYHVGNVEYAVQALRNRGRQMSNFGAIPESRSWQAVVRYYF
ncbi:MAG: hypothetical protein H7Z39_15620 [Burkholderiaceae bacterium]|nr:hypothetical protein [Burkholderiaceae bacterium]